MGADKFIELMQHGEHSEENWKEAWDQVRASTAMEPHGVELQSVDAEQLVLEMEIGDHARQPFGLLHGGMSMLLAESAASMHSCWDLDITRRFPVGIEINGSHIRSAAAGIVEVRANLIRRSSTLVHHRVEVVDAGAERELSIIRTTNLLRDVK